MSRSGKVVIVVIDFRPLVSGFYASEDRKMGVVVVVWLGSIMKCIYIGNIIGLLKCCNLYLNYCILPYIYK
jgi:hypothetical protein